MTNHRWYPITAMIISFIGFLDATYLSIEHYSTFRLPCSITKGCEIVTTSSYSEILGIPVALLGALYYIGMFLVVYGLLEFHGQKYLKYVAMASVTGFLFSGWFMYVQIFILHALCQYCIISALTSTVLFAISLVYFKQLKTSAPSPSLDEVPLE